MERVKLSGRKLTRSGGSVAAFSALWLFGCDPVVSIAGADFPDWLLCVILGSFLSAACHPPLRRSGLERHLRPLPFFYGSLIVMFSLVAWVIFFNRA
jgi:YtcA family